jgi:hypothetical protein
MNENRRNKRLPHHYAAAFREAGHAVAAWQRSVMLMPVSIFTTGKGAGRNVWNDPLRNVDFRWVRTAESSALVERLASVLLAGPLSEASFGPDIPKGTASVERLRDAKSLLNSIPRGTRGGENPYESARGKTNEFLADPRVRKAVCALAAVLLERGTILGGEAASIIEAHLGKRRST